MSEEFEDITSNRGPLVKTAQMQIGGSFRGKLVALENSTKYPDKQNLIMEDENGQPFTVFTSGSLSYKVKDGELEVGRTYVVTRLENKQTKQGASRTQFKVLRLKADGSPSAPTENSVKPVGKRK